MSLVHRALAVATGAIILGALAAATLVTTGVVDDAAAQGLAVITPAKLKQVQRVSIAAVKRSNANKAGLAALTASTAADIAGLKTQLANPLPAATGALAKGQTVRGAFNMGGTGAAG